METNRVNQFNVLYRTGNLRKAADILGISHSGLSKSMHSLQQELGLELFQQEGRGIIFTDFGHLFAKKVPDFLSSLNSLLSLKNAQENKSFRIGSFEVFSTYFLKIANPLFDNFKVEFHELVPGELERALSENIIDVGITYEPVATAGIQFLKVATIEMGIYCIKNAFKGTCIEDIPFAAPLIPVEGSPTGVRGLDSWPDHQFPRNVEYKVDLMETALSLTRSGRCAVFVPHFIAKLNNELVKSEFQLVKRQLPNGMKDVQRNVYIVKRESTIEDSAIKQLAKYIRKLN